jgi:hypothetical protein
VATDVGLDVAQEIIDLIIGAAWLRGAGIGSRGRARAKLARRAGLLRTGLATRRLGRARWPRRAVVDGAAHLAIGTLRGTRLVAVLVARLLT